MKTISALFLIFLITISSSQNIDEQPNLSGQELALVTFKCESCTAKNKFSVSGPTKFTVKQVNFPFTKKMEPGKYRMTYWQNRVRQIHLPFTVTSNLENEVTVK